jgi:hypothetical protein
MDLSKLLIYAFIIVTKKDGRLPRSQRYAACLDALPPGHRNAEQQLVLVRPDGRTEPAEFR